MVRTPPPVGKIVLKPLAPLNALVMFCGSEDSAEVRQAYDALAPHAVHAPFQRQSWLSSWQAHVGNGRQSCPVTVIGYRAGEACVLLPLSLDKRGAVSSFVWRGEEYCDYCAPLLQSAFSSQFNHELFRDILSEAGRALGGVDIAKLQKQPSRLGDFSTIHHGIKAVAYHVSAHATRLQQDWLAYSRTKRSGKTLRKIRARLNALSSLGKLEIGFAKSKPEAISLVIQCLDLKTAQLRKLGYWNPLTSRGAAAMVIANFGARTDHDTWVAALKLNGKPLAVAYGFRNPQSWLVYQIAMDQGPTSIHSPGTHLLMFLLQHCCEQGVSTFDLSLGDETYKTDWCELRTDLVTDVMAFSPRGHARLALFTWASRIRRAISTRPALYNAAKVINRNIKTLSFR